jgi:transposase
VAAADVGAGGVAAAAAADRAEGRLMRLPSQWFLAVEPIDLRCGMDRLLVWVQLSGGSASTSVGYVFRNRAGSRIKLLLIDGTGVWLCVRRLHAGRFHWPRSTDDRCELSSEQFAWLCVGVDWMRLSTSVVPEHTF